MNATVPVLTEEQRTQYWRDGFLIGLPVLTPLEVIDFRTRLEGIEAEQRTAHGGTWEDRNHSPWKTPDHPMRTLYHELALHPAMVALATAILGPDLLIRNGDVFIKEPGMPRSVSWHLDTSMQDGTQDAFCTVWVGLGIDGATTANGGMQFLRGGHRLDIPDRPQDRDSLSFSEQALSVVTPDRVVQCQMPPGHASVHHMCLPHYSAGNRTRQRRIGFALRYMATSISQAQAESGRATLVQGQDTHHHFSLKPDFPVAWQPQIP